MPFRAQTGGSDRAVPSMMQQNLDGRLRLPTEYIIIMALSTSRFG
jgi:hypothetical protein